MPRTQPPEEQLNMNHFKITERKGYHKVKERIPRHIGGITHGGCGCAPTTDKGGAYRDKVAESTNTKETTWDRIRFYHQAPVVKKNADIIRVNTHGHGLNPTTRERINKELPKGFNLVQRDYEVKLEVPNGDTVDLPVEEFDIQPIDNSIRTPEGDLILHYQSRKQLAHA